MFKFEKIDFHNLNEVISFRKHIYKEVFGENYDERRSLVSDKFDQFSDHFLVKNSNGEILGATRIIVGSKTGGNFPHLSSTSSIAGKNSIEISRLVIGASHRGKVAVFSMLLGKSLQYINDHYRNSSLIVDTAKNIAEFGCWHLLEKVSCHRGNTDYFDRSLLLESRLFFYDGISAIENETVNKIV